MKKKKILKLKWKMCFLGKDFKVVHRKNRMNLKCTLSNISQKSKKNLINNFLATDHFLKTSNLLIILIFYNNFKNKL